MNHSNTPYDEFLWILQRKMCFLYYCHYQRLKIIIFLAIGPFITKPINFC